MEFDLEKIRSQFPALAITDEGRSRVYLDNPAGTQVPLQVINRMRDYLIQCNANQGGRFNTSMESDRVLEEAHEPVEEGRMRPDDFRDFSFANAARFFTETRPDFFRGTRVEEAVESLQTAETAAPKAPAPPSAGSA